MYTTRPLRLPRREERGDYGTTLPSPRVGVPCDLREPFGNFFIVRVRRVVGYPSLRDPDPGFVVSVGPVSRRVSPESSGSTSFSVRDFQVPYSVPLLPCLRHV